ncbi:MAG: RNA pseudouridine synthase [Methylibium sp.]|uniref:RluA family pseudouridine synthase n=1 Tax=Methylibium sp. TaxID=2067992 RepID=UPI0018117A7B|nr:pseudouridine synthase [Methylibium sp.]MBA3596066.1 RNA pseudouridine synthase [Methylibium sp.]
MQVVYADAHLLIIDKPAGLLAVPGRGEAKRDCLAARVQDAFADALIVHRLDQATSGLMVFARGLDAQRRLSRAFEQREVGKRYMAVVAGCPVQASGRIDLPLAADWPRRPRQQVDHVHGKASLTCWRVLTVQAERDCSRLELEPLTGRSHQLRVHLGAIGHPILGDLLYAPPEIQRRAPRLLLHASELELAHPATEEPHRFASTVPF